MPEEIGVDMARMKITKAPNKLVALGIGSCIVITLYDPILKIGALAHTMLPSSAAGVESRNPLKYADKAIDEMIRKMKAMGSMVQDLEAKIVGGANMFPSIKSKAIAMGEENINAVKKKLEKEGIRLTGEATGGGVGRSVEFDIGSGVVTIRIKI